MTILIGYVTCVVFRRGRRAEAFSYRHRKYQMDFGPTMNVHHTSSRSAIYDVDVTVNVDEDGAAEVRAEAERKDEVELHALATARAEAIRRDRSELGV